MAKNNHDTDSYFKNPNKRKRNSGNKIGKSFILLSLLIFIIALASFGFYVAQGLPSLEELENPKPQLASKVFSADGELIGQFYIENRIETNIDSLPQHLIDALISTEDRKFYSHWGVDMERFVKAMFKNIFLFSREGASTLTQQLAKNLYELKIGEENLFETGVRKLREWITAIQIERNYTKNEILELYLNISFFGKSAYGVESASRIYFNKKAFDISVEESALLVALLKSHVFYDPVRRPEAALKRRNLVLYNMVDNNLLSEEKYNELKNNPIVLASERIGQVSSIAPHFMEYVRQQMSAMASKYGYDLYRDGLNIYTTLDFRMQKIANKVAKEHLTEYQQIFNKNWNWDRNKDALKALVEKAIRNNEEYRIASKEEKEKIANYLRNSQSFIDSVKKIEETIQIGFVVIDQKTGQIKALVGGENQEFLYGLNHVTQIKRQPGSSFKPIVYAVAIENGYYPAYSILNQQFDYNGWSPKNSNHEYSGYMTLRNALAISSNVVAGRMTISDIAPVKEVLKYSKRLGISSELSPYPSIALGTAEISPLEMTSAFGTFANGGVHVSPISILKIEDKNGIVIDQFYPEFNEAVTPETATIMTDLMQQVVTSGTGAGVRRHFHYPAGGKTGTTQEFADAWFIGFTPHFSAGVWVGFDDRRVRFNGWYGQGAKAALPVWAKFMAEAYKELNIPVKYFENSNGVSYVNFCSETIEAGDSRVAGPYCNRTISDMVNSKQIPPSCEIHRRGGVTRSPVDKNGDSGW